MQEMIDYNRTLPVEMEVSAAEVLRGIFEIKGMLSTEGDNLHFEYRTFGIMQKSTEIRRLSIQLNDVQDVAYKSNGMSYRIILFPKQLSLMRDIPGAKRDKAVFQVKRANKEEAEFLVISLRNRLFELGESGMDSVPFKLEDTNMGFTEHRGLLYIEDEFLVFDLLSGLFGVNKGERHIIKIELSAIESVRHHRGNMADHIYIRPKKDQLLNVVPGEFKREVKLKLKKDHRKAAERLLSRIKYAITSGEK